MSHELTMLIHLASRKAVAEIVDRFSSLLADGVDEAKVNVFLNEAAGIIPAELEAHKLSIVFDETDDVPDLIREVVEAWNTCPHVRHIKELEGKRKTSLKQRLSEPFFRDNWQAAIERVCKSPFCRGENEKGWVADFDWFVRPGTVAKIQEGKYDARGRAVPVGVKL